MQNKSCVILLYWLHPDITLLTKDSLLPAVRGVDLGWWLGTSCFNDVGGLTVLLFWVEGGFDWELAAFLFWLGGRLDWELAEPFVSAELIQSDMLCGRHHAKLHSYSEVSTQLSAMHTIANDSSGKLGWGPVGNEKITTLFPTFSVAAISWNLTHFSWNLA